MGYALAAIVFLNPIRVDRMAPLSIAAGLCEVSVLRSRCGWGCARVVE